MNDPFDSRLANLVMQRLSEDIQAKSREFPSRFIREDAAATGMNCASLMGEIRGLEIAQKHIEEVYNELNGKGPTKESKR